MWNKIGWRTKVKRSGENATNFTSRRRHLGLPMIVIRWHFRLPEAPQELHYEVTSQTCFAAHASSRLFSGRNVDRTRESGGNRAYCTRRVIKCSFLLLVINRCLHVFQIPWSFLTKTNSETSVMVCMRALGLVWNIATTLAVWVLSLSIFIRTLIAVLCSKMSKINARLWYF